VHGKRAVVGPARKLTGAELQQRGYSRIWWMMREAAYPR
jgi:hypothetical protein